MKDTTVTLEAAKAAAKELTEKMDALFAMFPHLEAPEYMPNPELKEWDTMYKIRKGIFDRIDRVERANNELSHFLKMEVL